MPDSKYDVAAGTGLPHGAENTYVVGRDVLV